MYMLSIGQLHRRRNSWLDGQEAEHPQYVCHCSRRSWKIHFDRFFGEYNKYLGGRDPTQSDKTNFLLLQLFLNGACRFPKPVLLLVPRLARPVSLTPVRMNRNVVLPLSQRKYLSNEFHIF